MEQAQQTNLLMGSEIGGSEFSLLTYPCQRQRLIGSSVTLHIHELIIYNHGHPNVQLADVRARGGRVAAGPPGAVARR